MLGAAVVKYRANSEIQSKETRMSSSKQKKKVVDGARVGEPLEAKHGGGGNRVFRFTPLWERVSHPGHRGTR